MRECRECGKQYEGNFCPYCGAKWTDEQATERVCPDCGTTVAAGMRFCTNCGYDFASKRSSAEAKAEKKMQSTLERTANFMEAIPSMLRIGNAVLSAIFSILLWVLFALPVTTILGESVGNLYQFMNGTTILGELLGKFSQINLVMLLAVAASIYAPIVSYITIAGRKEKKTYVKHCLYNLAFVAFYVIFFVIGCILRSKVSGFGLTVGACATSLMICSAIFFVISLALIIPAFVLSASVPLTPEEQAEKEARKAALIAKAKKIAKPACAIGAVALTVVIIVSISTNIFRAGKVDNIAIGDSEATVLDILGEPYEKRTDDKFLYAEYVKADYDDVWKYYSKEYTDLFDRMDAVEGEMEGSDSILDAGGLVGIGGILGEVGSITGDGLKLHYKYIEVAFKDGAVVAVYFDRDRTTMEELDGELKQKSDVSTASFAPFEYTGCEGGGYGKTQLTMKYADGSYAIDVFSVKKHNSQLTWSDFKGEQTYYFNNPSTWNGTKIGTEQHTADAWETTKEPTCTEDGRKDTDCVYCNVDMTETIPATGHTGAYEVTQSPTCTKTGSAVWENCEACGAKNIHETIPATGHAPAAMNVVAKEPTCTKNGERQIEYCTVCDAIVTTVDIPATGHKNQNGTCSVCSAVLSLGNSTYYIRVDAEGKANANGSYILFGEYPQTLKAESVTITPTTDSRGYYLGSDGFYYAKVTADPYDSSLTFSSGTMLVDGTGYYFKVEPLRWRILSESDGNALILCDSIIANKRFDDSSNNYKDSEIRAWLNDQFYSTAFNSLQKELIDTVLVDNSVASTGFSSNPYACEDTNDKVFLLSHKEVTNSDYGFESSDSSHDPARRMTVSDYARATGAFLSWEDDYNTNGTWWLRSPSNITYRNCAREVSASGRPGHNGNYRVNIDYKGVVPALQIRLE